MITVLSKLVYMIEANRYRFKYVGFLYNDVSYPFVFIAVISVCGFIVFLAVQGAVLSNLLHVNVTLQVSKNHDPINYHMIKNDHKLP